LKSGAALALFAAAAIVRVAVLPLPGMEDVTAFRIWTYNATQLGPTHVYGHGGWPPAWEWIAYNGMTSRVDYPPLALLELAGVGHLYRAVYPDFPDTVALTVAIKLLALIAGVTLTAVIFTAVRRASGAAGGRWASLAYWANPAVVVHGPVLGYLGEIVALPAVAAIAAASRGMSLTTGALFAAACLTKPQGLLVFPAVAVAVARHPMMPGRRVALALAGAAAVSVVTVWPYASAGTFPNMGVAVANLLTDGFLSGNAANLWWLADYARQTAQRVSDGVTLAAALRVPAAAVGMREFLAGLGAPSSDLAMAALAALSWSAVVAAVYWAVRQVRQPQDLSQLAALAAFTVHAYAVLAVQVHENHMFLALPLLAIVAATHRRYRWLLVAVSAIVALNLLAFYGFGEPLPSPLLRAIAGIDITVPLAALNCAALAWHASSFRLQTSDFRLQTSDFGLRSSAT
jgi:hypothetical protein